MNSPRLVTLRAMLVVVVIMLALFPLTDLLQSTKLILSRIMYVFVNIRFSACFDLETSGVLQNEFILINLTEFM